MQVKLNLSKSVGTVRDIASNDYGTLFTVAERSVEEVWEYGQVVIKRGPWKVAAWIVFARRTETVQLVFFCNNLRIFTTFVCYTTMF